jgi:hypothetical protein
MAGDPVARSLFDVAAGELADGIAAAARLLHVDETEILVSYQGGLSEHCPLLIQQLQRRVQQRLTNARVVPPRWRPLVGAYLLACSELGWEGKVA